MRMSNLLFTIFMLIGLAAYAQNPGDIDEDWAENGTAWYTFDDQYLQAICTEMQSDGKIISAGYLLNNSLMETYIFAQRINEDGSLDDFGNHENYFLLNISGSDIANCMYINPLDEIFIVSSSINTNIVKLNPEGELDLTFGESGIASNTLISGVQEIKPFPVETNEHLILCGGTINPGDSHPGLSVILEDGTTNESFGEDGVASIADVGGHFFSVCYLPENEEIYACGLKMGGSSNQLLIAKFTAGGELDISFGEGGYIVEENPIGYLEIYAPELIYDQEHDQLIMGFHITWADGDTDIVLRKLTSDGEPVNSFGDEGWAHITMPSSNETFSSIALQEDGMVYFAGSTALSGTEDHLLGKVKMDGYLDTEFGENGLVEYDHRDRVNLSNDIILNPDEGRLILGGTTRSSDNTESVMTVSKFFTGFYSGTADYAFENQARAEIYPNPVSSLLSIKIPDSKDQICEVSLFSGSGKLEHQVRTKITDGKITASLPQIPDGVYILLINCRDHSYTGKIIVSRLY